jgi:predicted transcriptional regulator
MTDRPTRFAPRLGSSAVTSDSSRAEKLRAIREARESIEREGTIPFEEIEAWVDSWDTPNELPQPQPRKR